MSGWNDVVRNIKQKKARRLARQKPGFINKRTREQENNLNNGSVYDTSDNKHSNNYDRGKYKKASLFYSNRTRGLLVMKYTLNAINQAGIVEYGLETKTDIIDWVILDYISTNPSMSYKQLMRDIPLLKLNNKSSISRRISKLLNLGLVAKKLYTDKDAFEHLGSNHNIGCISCGSIYLLENHHYPVRRKNNGVETIVLCRGCHQVFHLLTDVGLLIISDFAKKIINKVEL